MSDSTAGEQAFLIATLSALREKHGPREQSDELLEDIRARMAECERLYLAAPLPGGRASEGDRTSRRAIERHSIPGASDHGG